MFGEVKTCTTNTPPGGTATTVLTKPGLLTPRDRHTQNNHLPTESSSKSSQEWTDAELSSTVRTLVDNNTDSESEITTQEKASNGGNLIQEQEPSEHSTKLNWSFPTKRVKNSILVRLPLLENGAVITTKEFHGTEVREETSETTVESALMFGEDKTKTISTLPGGTATMVLIKLGSSTKEESISQNHHMKMESNSRSRQR